MESLYLFLAVLAATVVVSMGATRFLITYLRKRGVIDNPNQRSSHTIPTPRGGGIAILICVALALTTMKLLAPEQVALPGVFFFVGGAIIAFISYLDDKITLSAKVRFAIHIIAAGLIIYETGGIEQLPLPAPLNIELGWVAYPLSLFWILAVLNIYNFLDGIDGFAGMQAFLAGVAMAALDYNGVGFYVGGAIAASSLGFLRYNWHPAKIFMGDIGSASLGFLFATVPFYFTSLETSLGVYAMSIFLWFFLADGAFTIIRRLLNGEKIWEAHRSHLYQKLVIAGMSHDRVVRYVLLSACSLVAGFLGVYYYMPDFLAHYLWVAIGMFVVYWFTVNKVIKIEDAGRKNIEERGRKYTEKEQSAV